VFSCRKPSDNGQVAVASSPCGETGRTNDVSELLRTTNTANSTSCDDSTDIARSSRTCSPPTTTTSDRPTHCAVEHRPAVSRAKVKTVKLTVAVVLSYLVCWCPFFVSQMWAVWDEQAPFEGQSAETHPHLLQPLK
jgi:hypothetical protein